MKFVSISILLSALLFACLASFESHEFFDVLNRDYKVDELCTVSGLLKKMSALECPVKEKIFHFTSPANILQDCIIVRKPFGKAGLAFIFPKRPEFVVSVDFENFFDDVIRLSCGINPLEDDSPLQQCMLGKPMHDHMRIFRQLEKKSRDFFRCASKDGHSVHSSSTHDIVVKERMKECNFISHDFSGFFFLSPLLFVNLLLTSDPDFFLPKSSVKMIGIPVSVVTLSVDGQTPILEEIFFLILRKLLDLDILAFITLNQVCKSWYHVDNTSLISTGAQLHEYISLKRGNVTAAIMVNALKKQGMFAKFSDKLINDYLANYACYPVKLENEFSMCRNFSFGYCSYSVLNHFLNGNQPIPYDIIKSMKIDVFVTSLTIHRKYMNNKGPLAIRILQDHDSIKSIQLSPLQVLDFLIAFFKLVISKSEIVLQDIPNVFDRFPQSLIEFLAEESKRTRSLSSNIKK